MQLELERRLADGARRRRGEERAVVDAGVGEVAEVKIKGGDEEGTEPVHHGNHHKGAAALPSNKDGGALFVLESKGNWKHAGFHLSTAIVAPWFVSLPNAFAGLGWAPGVVTLVVGTVVSFYAYMLLSQVLEHAEIHGHRLLRFRDVAQYALGRKWGYYPVAVIRIVLCLVTVIACTVIGGQSLKLIYRVFHPDGTIQLFVFTILFGIVMMVLSQLPSFHSLRYINLASQLCSLGYSLCAVGGCIYADHLKNAPPKDYTVAGTPTVKFFGVFFSLVIILSTFGDGMIPETQATLAPPVTGKMFKGLLMCYAAVLLTFFPVAVAGYWAFGNKAQGNIFLNLEPYNPKWLNFLSNFLVLAQLVAVALTYAQPTIEIFEGRTSDVEKGIFAARNLIPRFFVRTGLVTLATLVAAALPFFGDINATIGAFGFTPLDFVLPFVLFSAIFSPSRRTLQFWLHTTIIIVFSLIGLLGCIASVRQVAVDASSYKLFANFN